MRRTAEWLENPRNLWRAVRIRWRLRYVSLLVAYLMGVLQGAISEHLVAMVRVESVACS